MSPEDFHAKLGSFPAEPEPKIFKPSAKAKFVASLFLGKLTLEAETRFFEIWEAEIGNPEAPRRAGSVLARCYLEAAAKVAIFGAICSDVEPSLGLFLAKAEKCFEEMRLEAKRIFEREKKEDAAKIDPGTDGPADSAPNGSGADLR